MKDMYATNRAKHMKAELRPFSPISSNSQMPCTWREYIANVLLESGFVTRAAILGQDGRRWAASPGFEVTSQEVQLIVDGFIEPSKLRSGGISLGCKKYTCTRMDSTIMVGRDTATGNGCVIFKCKNCLLIGVYEDGTHPGGCYNMVVKVGDYLKDQGF